MRVRLIETKTELKRKTWGWKEGELERAKKVPTPVNFMSTFRAAGRDKPCSLGRTAEPVAVIPSS